MTRLYAGAAAAALVIGLGGIAAYTFLARSDDPFAHCRSSAVSGGTGSIGGPFSLVSETGVTVTDADIITKPTLLYFGYTFCPDVCPLDTVRNADAVDLLAERGLDVLPVFISIDPNRDTPERLAEFTDYIHPDMIGLTGSDDQVRAASQAYKTYYRKQDGDPEYYLVDHSTFTYLVLPDHGFVEFFRRDMTSEALADSAACFIEAG